MKHLSIFFAILLIFFTCCSENENEEGEPVPGITSKTDSTQIPLDSKWRYNYDFDGDSEADSITFTYSSSAHCCYQLMIHLSERQSALILPLYIEGGYIVFDLSKPGNFDVRDEDKNNIHELFVNLSHYGEHRSEEELAQLQEKYLFKGTRVIVSLEGGNILIRDAIE